METTVLKNKPANEQHVSKTVHFLLSLPQSKNFKRI